MIPSLAIVVLWTHYAQRWQYKWRSPCFTGYLAILFDRLHTYFPNELLQDNEHAVLGKMERATSVTAEQVVHDFVKMVAENMWYRDLRIGSLAGLYEAMSPASHHGRQAVVFQPKERFHPETLQPSSSSTDPEPSSKWSNLPQSPSCLRSCCKAQGWASLGRYYRGELTMDYLLEMVRSKVHGVQHDSICLLIETVLS